MKKYTHEMMTFKEFLTFIYPFLHEEEPSFTFRYFSQFRKDLVLHHDSLPDDFDTMFYYFHTKGNKSAKKCLLPLYGVYMERTIDVPDIEVPDADVPDAEVPTNPQEVI